MAKYTARPEDIQKAKDSFQYHPAKDDQPERYASNRQAAFDFWMILCGNCPPGRDLAVAFTHIEEALRAANAAIAILEDKGGQDAKS